MSKKTIDRIIWAIFWISLLIALGLAGASDRADAFPRTDRSMKIAEHVWHPNHNVRVRFSTAPSVDYEDAGGWAALNGGEIVLNADHLWEGEPHICVVILHEMGHAVGVGHSENPLSIMFPEHMIDHGYSYNGRSRVDIWGGIDRRCLPAALAKVKTGRKLDAHHPLHHRNRPRSRARRRAPLPAGAHVGGR